MSYIQLPDKIVDKVEQIQLNLPKDKKAKDLFAHLPYIANLQDPILQNRVEDLLKNREDLQNYLLAPEFLNTTLEDSLQLAVSHGKLNEGTKVRHLSELNDPQYKYFRQNNNPLDVVYKENAKFDVQNPIIGDLLKQINKGKNDDEYFNAIKKAPDAKDLSIQDRFNKVFNRDTKKRDNILNEFNNNNNDDDDPGQPGGPGHPRSPPGSPGIPRPLVMRDFFPDEYDNPFNLDLNDLENQYWGRDIPIQKEREEELPIQIDTNLKEIFPDADQVLEVDGNYYSGPESYERQQYYPYKFRFKPPQPEVLPEMPPLEEIKSEIIFFNGEPESANVLSRQMQSDNRIEPNREFVSFLTSEACRDALQRDNMSIHVPTGDIFINNQNTQESLYGFLDNQSDETKKDIPLDFSYDDDLNDYMTKYLPSINDYDEMKYDFLANKNSKFLFNLFNKHQERLGRKTLAVKHTKVSADDYALQKLQERNWPYFIDRIIQFSQGFLDLNDVITTDPEEVNILNDTRSNFEITKNLYNELLTSVGINLHEYFMNLGIEEKNKIDKDLNNNGYYGWNPNDVNALSEILLTYKNFYYDYGRFPGRLELIHLPTPIMPSFVKSRDWISPRSLADSYVSRDMQGVTSVQFLAVFHRFLGGDVELSRAAMNEFFHNLSWQALTNENDKVKINFEAIAELVKNINFLLQKKIYESKKKTQEINNRIQNKLLEKEIAQIRSKNQQVEQEIVKDILKNNTTDYTTRYNYPTIKTDAEVEREKTDANKNYIATELVKKVETFN